MRDKYFPFGEQEITWLKSRDPQLGAFVSEMGKPKRKLLPDLFSGLLGNFHRKIVICNKIDAALDLNRVEMLS